MLVLGHRGASVAAQENTPAAFELADAQGADGVELDVRLTADGRLVVAHDPVPASPAEVEAMEPSSLAEVLDACGDRMLVNVEIKNRKSDPDHDPTMTIVRRVVDELERRGTPDRWLVSSFSWSTVAACRELAAGIATACLTSGVVDVAAIEGVALAGHSALHPREDLVDGSLVDRCHAAGLSVNTWTCNEPQRLAELAGLGVDGVCTDAPDVALAALGRRGAVASPQWVTHRR